MRLFVLPWLSATFLATAAPPDVPPPPAPIELPLSPVAGGKANASVIQYEGAPFGQVIRELARKAKENFVIDASITNTVTIRLEDKTPREAIDVICAANGLVIEELHTVHYVRPWDHAFKREAEREAHVASLLLDAYMAKGFTRPEAVQLVAARGERIFLEPARAMSPASKATTRRSR